jgi:hypothetical protein
MGKRLIVAFVAAGLFAGSSKAQTVVLTSDPTGATILLRGAVEVRPDPAIAAITARVANAGYISVGFIGAANGNSDIGNGASGGARFEHVYGTLIVVSDRMDAVLRVDRADYGNVPRLLLLSPGRHKVFCRPPMLLTKRER